MSDQLKGFDFSGDFKPSKRQLEVVNDTRPRKMLGAEVAIAESRWWKRQFAAAWVRYQQSRGRKVITLYPKKK